MAVKPGHLRVVQELVRAGCQIQSDLRQCPLVAAACRGHSNVVDLLLGQDCMSEERLHAAKQMVMVSAASAGHEPFCFNFASMGQISMMRMQKCYYRLDTECRPISHCQNAAECELSNRPESQYETECLWDTVEEFSITRRIQ
jgi:hypothetical protein